MPGIKGQTHVFAEPNKKRKVALEILGVEIPSWAFERYLWLQHLIYEIKKLTEPKGE